MAGKIYKTAMGKSIDMGALLLENELTRAVGNMKVNARGDILNSVNRVVETKNKLVQKHYQRQATNTTEQLPTSSTRAAKKQHAQKKVAQEKIAKDTGTPAKSVRNRKAQPAKKSVPTPPPAPEIPEIETMEELNEIENKLAIDESVVNEPVIEPIAEPDPVEEDPVLSARDSIPRGGLAAAMARSKTVKQELLKTQRQQFQTKPGVNKI